MELSTDHAANVAEFGFSIIPNVFDESTADRLAERIMQLEQSLDIKPAMNTFEGHRTTRIYNLLAHGPDFEAIPTNSTVLPLVDSVLDPGALVSSLSSIAIRPGERAQPLHADDALHPIQRPHIATVCNTMWAVTDFTAENGATLVVPRSHRFDTTPTYAEPDPRAIPAEMPKGSVLIWHGSLWHGGGPNNSRQTRIGLAMNYCAGWIRQQENQQLGLPQDLIRSFPKRLQDLVGYGTYGGLIGHIDKQKPRHWLFGAPEVNTPGEPRSGPTQSEPTMLFDRT